MLLTEDMPAAPDGHAYALWLQHDDEMVPAGIMPEGPDNAVLLDGDAATADGAGITVEEAGTEPTEPAGRRGRAVRVRTGVARCPSNRPGSRWSARESLA